MWLLYIAVAVVCYLAACNFHKDESNKKAQQEKLADIQSRAAATVSMQLAHSRPTATNYTNGV